MKAVLCHCVRGDNHKDAVQDFVKWSDSKETGASHFPKSLNNPKYYRDNSIYME